MIQGYILAGTRSEYCGYLFKHHLKERDWPQLSLKKQIYGFHQLPPVVCYGTYYKNNKFREIRLIAQNLGARIIDEDGAQK